MGYGTVRFIIDSINAGNSNVLPVISMGLVFLLPDHQVPMDCGDAGCARGHRRRGTVVPCFGPRSQKCGHG